MTTPEEREAESTERARFAGWKAAVDVDLQRLTGLGADDLPDKPWWDWMESGMTPQEAANEALNEEGW